MAKVTSKLQVTVPKAIADKHALSPGMEVDFESAGETIRIRIRRERQPTDRDVGWRLHSFDEATKRQRGRDEHFRAQHPSDAPSDRGWTREDLYRRGVAR